MPDHVHIVEGDPLVLLVGVGPHGPRRVVHHAPALAPHQRADLVVSQETLGAGELARSAATDSRGIQTLDIKIIALLYLFYQTLYGTLTVVPGGCVQGEGLAVHGHAQHQLARPQPSGQPVVHRVVLKCSKQCEMAEMVATYLALK